MPREEISNEIKYEVYTKMLEFHLKDREDCRRRKLWINGLCTALDKVLEDMHISLSRRSEFIEFWALKPKRGWWRDSMYWWTRNPKNKIRERKLRQIIKQVQI